MERSDRALESARVTRAAVVRRGRSYQSRQHGKLGLASRSVKTGRTSAREVGGGGHNGDRRERRARDEEMEIERVDGRGG